MSCTTYQTLNRLVLKVTPRLEPELEYRYMLYHRTPAPAKHRN